MISMKKKPGSRMIGFLIALTLVIQLMNNYVIFGSDTDILEQTNDWVITEPDIAEETPAEPATEPVEEEISFAEESTAALEQETKSYEIEETTETVTDEAPETETPEEYGEPVSQEEPGQEETTAFDVMAYWSACDPEAFAAFLESINRDPTIMEAAGDAEADTARPNADIITAANTTITNDAFIRQLLSHLGAGYSNANRYGPTYFDCSGLIYSCFNELGNTTNVPANTSGWRELVESMSIGETKEIGGITYQLVAANVNTLSDPEYFTTPGTLMVMIAPGAWDGHIAVSLGKFDRPVVLPMNGVETMRQLVESVITRVSNDYGAAQSTLTATGFYGQPRVWYDGDYMGTEIITNGATMAHSGPYASIWKIDALNDKFGVSINNHPVAKYNSSNVRGVLVPITKQSDEAAEFTTTSIKASGTGSGQVTVTWDKVPGAVGYLVYGKTSAAGVYHQLGITAYTNYVDKTASNDEWNFYWVYPYTKDTATGVITIGKSAKYAYGKGTMPKLPAAQNFKAASTESGVALMWDAVNGAEGYIIYTKTASEIGSHYLSMRTHAGSGASATTYTDKTASDVEWNFYWIFPYYTEEGSRVCTTGTDYAYGKKTVSYR